MKTKDMKFEWGSETIKNFHEAVAETKKTFPVDFSKKWIRSIYFKIDEKKKEIEFKVDFEDRNN